MKAFRRLFWPPPDGLGPVQTAYIVTEQVGDHAMVATLLYMAERGLVRLDSAKPTQWTVTGIGTGDQWAAVDPVTREVGDALGISTAGAKLRVTGSQTTGLKLSDGKDRLGSSCRSWAAPRDWWCGSQWSGSAGCWSFSAWC